MSDNIKKDKIVGMKDMPLNVDYDALKKGLEQSQGQKLSPFDNFFNKHDFAVRPENFTDKKED